MTAKKRKTDEERASKTPVLVRLASGAVTSAAYAELACIWQCLEDEIDSDIWQNRGLVIERLLMVISHIQIRLSVYAEYPTRAVLMCQVANESGWQTEISSFLNGEPHRLDKGRCYIPVLADSECD